MLVLLNHFQFWNSWEVPGVGREAGFATGPSSRVFPACSRALCADRDTSAAGRLGGLLACLGCLPEVGCVVLYPALQKDADH